MRSDGCHRRHHIGTLGAVAQGVAQATALLHDAPQLQRRALQAQRFAQAHQGAAQRTAQAVVQLLR